MKNKLSFQKGNAKLGKHIWTFSLPSGWTCPGANECLARANRTTGKITDGPGLKFRCFSASQEALYPSVRKSRWHNMTMLKKAGDRFGMAELIDRDLPGKDGDIYRIHVAGDFFSQDYMAAWIEVATLNPNRLFYAYTKSIHFWSKLEATIPENFKLNASKGGKHDELIKVKGYKYAEVVMSIAEARAKTLEIDHDDSMAYKQDSSFALLIHGTQPKGTESAKALAALREEGIGGYSRS